MDASTKDMEEVSDFSDSDSDSEPKKKTAPVHRTLIESSASSRADMELLRLRGDVLGQRTRSVTTSCKTTATAVKALQSSKAQLDADLAAALARANLAPHTTSQTGTLQT